MSASRLASISAGSRGANVQSQLFSPLERLVIRIGSRDPAHSIKRGSLLAKLQWLLFGIEAPRPFADPRLEALRRLSTALRQQHRSADEEIEAALAAGVSQGQIEHLGSSSIISEAESM